MQDSLFAFCKWLESTGAATTIRSTFWGYPFVQLVHFSGLSLWVGTIAILDLRLLGVAVRRQSGSDLADQLFPWTWSGLSIAVTGGALLFASAATTYFKNPAFRVKFPLLLTGIAYHVVVQRVVGKWGQTLSTPAIGRVAGFLELLLWIGVITAAVNIPNY